MESFGAMNTNRSSPGQPEGGFGLLTGSRIGSSPFHRKGSFLLSERLAIDPFGSLYRGVALHGDRYGRHMLIRVFSGEFLRAARIGSRMYQATQDALKLGYERALGMRFVIEDEPCPLLASDYIPGRSLAQVLKRQGTERKGMEAGMALHVLGQIAHGVHRMHLARLPHGTLTAHSVWLGFQGQVRILDAPIARILSESLSRTPEARAALAPFLRPGEEDGIRQDLFQLGALLYMLLSGAPLADVRRPDPGPALVALHEAQGDPIAGAACLRLLPRLLQIGEPYRGLEEPLAELNGCLLHSGAPAFAFELAHGMQRTFRESWVEERLALVAESQWDFQWVLAQEARQQALPAPKTAPGSAAGSSADRPFPARAAFQKV